MYGGPSGSELFVSVAGAGSNRVRRLPRRDFGRAAAFPLPRPITGIWRESIRGRRIRWRRDDVCRRTELDAADEWQQFAWNAVAAGPQYVAVGQSSGDSIVVVHLSAAPTVSGAGSGSRAGHRRHGCGNHRDGFMTARLLRLAVRACTSCCGECDDAVDLHDYKRGCRRFGWYR
jgi:hypothetical protein